MKCNHAEQSDEPYGRICLMCGIVLETYDDERDYRDEDEEDYFDCGWMPGMGCTKAGDESCDFDCPFREELLRVLAHQEAKNA